MKILVTGANGQLGSELQKTVPKHYNIFTCDYPKVDICNSKQLDKYIGNLNPDMIINTAAYTAVDKAEEEKDRAFEVNIHGVSNVANAAIKCNARLIHISTDYVFDGKSFRPYKPDDKPSPLSVYGESKYRGEVCVREIHNNCIIIRTSWLYSSYGNNFVKSMLKLFTDKKEIKVVSDQIGTPTWTKGLSNFIWKIVASPNITGIYHWTDAGVASWYDFSVAIMEEALDLEMIQKKISIIPVSTEDYPTLAKRPAYSVLDKTSTWKINGEIATHWRVSLKSMLEEYKQL